MQFSVPNGQLPVPLCAQVHQVQYNLQLLKAMLEEVSANARTCAHTHTHTHTHMYTHTNPPCLLGE